MYGGANSAALVSPGNARFCDKSASRFCAFQPSTSAPKHQAHGTAFESLHNVCRTVMVKKNRRPLQLVGDRGNESLPFSQSRFYRALRSTQRMRDSLAITNRSSGTNFPTRVENQSRVFRSRLSGLKSKRCKVELIRLKNKLNSLLYRSRSAGKIETRKSLAKSLNISYAEVVRLCRFSGVNLNRHRRKVNAKFAAMILQAYWNNPNDTSAALARKVGTYPARVRKLLFA